MRPRPFLALLALAGVAGFVFASVSTYDFVAHLDRQVHGIHCSFIPGLSETDVSGTSGCHVTLNSPYSSVLRSTIWGGLPVSLPAMGVFAYLLFRALDALFNKREGDRGLANYMVAAAALPFLTSLFFGYLSLVELGAACKLCIGIYTSSTIGLIAAIGFRATAAPPTPAYDPYAPAPLEDEPDAGHQSGMGDHAISFFQGVGFVMMPILLYLAVAPDFSNYVGACGTLPKPEDTYNVMVPIDPNPSGRDTIEVMDPLCPSCKGFERRLESSGLGASMNRKLVLFPLDNTCNWMVSSTLHPGACTISEAVLCAGDQATAVMDWAFEHQDEIRTATAADPTAAATMVGSQFPTLKSCVGSASAKAKLNKSLRWAVSNKLSVMTPQVFVDGVKLCDEDTDLGMDFALSRLLENKVAPRPEARQGGL